MLFPFQNLQIGVERTVVEGGGNLADTAAQLLDDLAVGISTGLLITLFCCPFAQYLVEGEGFAGSEDKLIYGFAGQDQIVGPGRI